MKKPEFYIVSDNQLSHLIEKTEDKIRAAFMGWPIDRRIDEADAAHDDCTMKKAPEWVPMEERLPEFTTGDEEFLFLLKRQELIVIAYHGWQDDDGKSFYMYADGIPIQRQEVSHWMPLPEKPK